jgi:hypothetical protein
MTLPLAAPGLCDGCQEGYDAWLNYKSPPKPISAYKIDNTASEHRAYADRHWELVRSQLDLIKAICARGHTPLPGFEPKEGG